MSGPHAMGAMSAPPHGPRPLAVSMGDPAGVGPEITIGAWRALRVRGPAFAVFGPPDLYAALGAPIAAIASLDEASVCFSDALPVLPLALHAPVEAGRANAAHAAPVLASIERAVEAARMGAAAGVVTNPIAKHVLYEAGFDLPGHTELLARLTEDDPCAAPRGPVMMLAGGGLKVSLATIHVPLADVPQALTRERIMRVARVTARALREDFGVAAPRLALAGLNPHAGEDGALGREEQTILNPAAAALRAEGLTISDAQSADALFAPHARTGYDVAIAMYHDQGLIPVKTLDFDGGVNITLGLPIVRTSPDHGAAFAIAGRGEARPNSLIAALDMAAAIAAQRTATRATLAAP